MTGPPFVSLFIKEFGNINYNFSELHPYFKTSYLIPITSAPNNINILMDKSSWTNCVFFNSVQNLKQITVQFFYYVGKDV